MKTATVRELRNDYAKLLRRVQAGEEIVITRRGEPVARLIPEKTIVNRKVDWTESPAFKRDRSKEPVLSAKRSEQIIRESRGRW